jgi:hypothetical protein
MFLGLSRLNMLIYASLNYWLYMRLLCLWLGPCL